MNDVTVIMNENYNSRGKLYRKGVWSLREDKKLIKAIKKVLNTEDLSNELYNNNISWVTVRDMSGLNRSPVDLRHRWRKKLRWRSTNLDQLMDNWTKSDSSKLIYILFKSDFDDEYDIDWDFIKEKFVNVISFNNLMKNWRIIKSTVPQYQTKTYKQIIAFLYDHFLPNFIRTDDDLKKFEEFYAFNCY